MPSAFILPQPTGSRLPVTKHVAASPRSCKHTPDMGAVQAPGYVQATEFDMLSCCWQRNMLAPLSMPLLLLLQLQLVPNLECFQQLLHSWQQLQAQTCSAGLRRKVPRHSSLHLRQLGQRLHTGLTKVV